MIGQSLSHMFRPVVRMGGSIERAVLDRQVTPTATSFFSWQALCVLSSSYMSACRTDTVSFPLVWLGEKSVEQPNCSWSYSPDVSMPEPEARSVNVWTEPIPWMFEDLYPINFSNFSERNSCHTTCLLSKDHLLTLLHDILQQHSPNTWDRKRLIFLCHVWSNVFMRWTRSPLQVFSWALVFSWDSSSKVNTDLSVEKVDACIQSPRG